MLENVLREAREAQHLKQAEVADYVGVTTQTYLKWENGKNEPKASHLKKLTEILKVTGSEMIEGSIIKSDVDQLTFMEEVSVIRNYIDDFSFLSSIYKGIEDKRKFLTELELKMKKIHGFGAQHLDTIPISVEEEAMQRLKDIEDHEKNVAMEELSKLEEKERLSELK